MKTRLKAAILAGTFIIATALPMTALAGRGGRTGGQVLQKQTTQMRRGQRLRLRDGSCLNAAKTRSSATEKKGNTYGPGDGTGYAGSGPKDGSGYGAPSEN